MTKRKQHESTFHQEIDDLKENLNHLKDTLIEHVADVAESAHDSEEKIIESMEAHPLVTLGLAAAVGFILGVLVTRK